MATKNSVTSKTSTTGDAAVAGLLHGLFAGLVMAAYLLLAVWLRGIDLVELWSRFAGSLANPLTGVLAHLAVSAVYGVVWGVLWQTLHRLVPALPAWLAGLAYGLLLALVSRFAAATLQPFMTDLGMVHWLVAHLVYGGVLGWLAGRGETNKGTA